MLPTRRMSTRVASQTMPRRCWRATAAMPTTTAKFPSPSKGHSKFRAHNSLALSLPRHLSWSRWRIRSCFPTRCRLGGRGLARGILRWHRLGCRLNSWWCRFLPWARRVSLRAIYPVVANNFLRFGDFYSAFKTVNSHLVSIPLLF